MTLLSFRLAEADDATLLRRARRGDRRAHRLYARRHAVRAIELVGLLLDDPTEATTLAAAVLDLAVAEGVADDDGLVRCAVRVLAPAAGEQGLARLALTLTDVEGRTEDTVAGLLGRTVDEVAEMRAAARADHGLAAAGGRVCRGWALAARRDRLTVSEQEAAHGHLQLCRSCRAQLDEQRRTRDKLRRSGAGVGAVVVGDVVALSMPAGGTVAGFGALVPAIVGKAGAALIGGTALAIVGASAGVAIARHSPSHHSVPAGGNHVRPHEGTQPPAGSSPQIPAAPTSAASAGGGTGTNAPGTRLAPTTLPTSVVSSTVSSLLTSPAPTLTSPLTSPLPLPLPTATSIITAVPLPVPTTTATTPVPVPLPTGVLSTATSLLGH
jgi:hypothetical protein